MCIRLKRILTAVKVVKLLGALLTYQEDISAKNGYIHTMGGVLILYDIVLFYSTFLYVADYLVTLIVFEICWVSFLLC